jgi:hypothetical protein
VAHSPSGLSRCGGLLICRDGRAQTPHRDNPSQSKLPSWARGRGGGAWAGRGGAHLTAHHALEPLLLPLPPRPRQPLRPLVGSLVCPHLVISHPGPPPPPPPPTTTRARARARTRTAHMSMRRVHTSINTSWAPQCAPPRLLAIGRYLRPASRQGGRWMATRCSPSRCDRRAPARSRPRRACAAGLGVAPRPWDAAPARGSRKHRESWCDSSHDINVALTPWYSHRCRKANVRSQPRAMAAGECTALAASVASQYFLTRTDVT